MWGGRKFAEGKKCTQQKNEALAASFFFARISRKNFCAKAAKFFASFARYEFLLRLKKSFKICEHSSLNCSS